MLGKWKLTWIKYLGIQRKLSPSRVKDLKEYVKSFDATFPTSIVLAVDESCASWDENSNELCFLKTMSLGTLK